MLYEFKEADAYAFARHVGIRAKQRGHNLHFQTCPYCRSAKDKDTFAIDLETGQFKCLRASCGVSGNMIQLSRDFDFSLGYTVDEYYRPKKRYKRLPTPKKPIIPKDKAVQYLESRGISAEVAKRYEITVHARHENTLVFPFFDDKGILQMIKYRDMEHFVGKKYTTKDGDEKKSPKEWVEEGCKPILFGMKQCNDRFDRLVVTEGQCFDGKAEILTPEGWIHFENYAGQQVLQIRDDLTGEFVRPKRFIVKRHTGDMVGVKIGGNYETYTTDDHNLVFIHPNGSLVKKVAREKIPSSYKIPTVTQINSNQYSNWTSDMFALYLAISADGTIDFRKNTGRKKAKSDRYVKIVISLERKASRLRNILDNLEIEYSDTKDSRGYNSICFHCPEWMESKYLPYEFATATSVEQKKFIIEEMVHWDGNKVNGRNQYEYTTIIKHNADVVQLIATACGYMSTIMSKQNGGNGNFKKGFCYKVSVLLKKSYISTQQFEKHKVISHTDQRVYCVTVDSGMILVRQNGKISVTGNCDSLSVATAGIENATSVPNGAQGMTWVPYCFNWVSKFEEIVVFGDFEKGNMTLLEDFQKRFPNKIKHVREQDYRGCKDANELLQKHGKEAVRQAVENAVLAPINRVLSLAEVESVNIYELPKLKTGISQLDRTLYGGLPFGMVCIIAGKRGDGKSTLASQIMANAVEQNYPTFAYSGELPNYLYKSWFDFQIAGRNHITENQTEYGTVNRFITNKNQELINAWYQDKAYIYDNRIIDSDEKEDLLRTLENSIMQYGIKVALVDNLMTAMYIDELQGSDKYDQQGRFVRELTKIAIRYDVLILLVAHRRKNNFTSDANDEISGSGDITNLAGITLSYDRGSRDEIEKGIMDESQRKLIVAKNRLFGKINPKGFILDYDERSKRIYGLEDDVNRQFGWDLSDGFMQINANMEVPF